MKKYIFPLILIFFVLLLAVYYFTKEPEDIKEPVKTNKNDDTEKVVEKEEPKTGIANPASGYCLENGGTLENVTTKDGSQFGMCNFGDYSCDTWVYFNGECNVEEDAEKIGKALIAKGLDLSEMKVVINKHLGKYIGGSVIPVSAPAGGGYVFAVKEGDEIIILADGNGAIMCEMLEDHPDYPAYLIPECVDEAGNPITR